MFECDKHRHWLTAWRKKGAFSYDRDSLRCLPDSTIGRYEKVQLANTPLGDTCTLPSGSNVSGSYHTGYARVAHNKNIHIATGCLRFPPVQTPCVSYGGFIQGPTLRLLRLDVGPRASVP